MIGVLLINHRAVFLLQGQSYPLSCFHADRKNSCLGQTSNRSKVEIQWL